MSSEQDFIVDMVSSIIEDTPNEEHLKKLQDRVAAMSPDELRKFFVSSLERLSGLNQSQALFHSLVDPNSDKCLDTFKHVTRADTCHCQQVSQGTYARYGVRNGQRERGHVDFWGDVH